MGQAQAKQVDTGRDRYPDALRAGALLVVVFGHWLATLPRLEDGRLVSTEHLLTVWDGAGLLTWVLQVVPLFVLVSAAVSTDGAIRRLDDGTRQRHWWAGRALGLARPAVTYLAVLAVLATIAEYTGAVAIVGGTLDGSSNVLPPTLALVGVMWVQTGAVLVFEGPARRALAHRPVGRVVSILGALGMGLYLWHKLAELPAAWLGERLGAPIDAGVPGEAAFWLGRLWWIALCLVMATPVMAAVIAFETRRRTDVPHATGTREILVGGALLLGGIIAALALGAQPGAAIGLAGVAMASWLLRAHGARRDVPVAEVPDDQRASLPR